MAKSRDKIPESKLLKAMAELEAEARKGDVMEDADPEGGLSAEGEPLSSAAPRGRGEGTRKSSRRSSASSPMASAGASSSGSAASSESDDGDDGDAASAMSSKKAPPFPPKRDKKKGGKVSKAESASSGSADSSSGGSDEDSDDESAEKSLRDRAASDETMRKGIEVSDFLEAMVDQISLAMLDVGRQMTKAIADMEARLTAHVDASVAKSIVDAGAFQRDFNARLAKGIAAIGTTVNALGELPDMVKAIADQPIGGPRGKSVLSKADVNQPPWGTPGQRGGQADGSGDGGVDVEALRGIPTNAVGDWLMKGVANNRIDQKVVYAWEADRYDPAFLPPAVQQDLARDLIK